MSYNHYMRNHEKQALDAGFTLIELLVVIAIIGLLASVVLASLNSARTKGRDARRLADLKEIATQIEVSTPSSPGTVFTGCTAARARVSTCTSPSLTAYKDPSGSSSACDGTNTSSCDYAISKGPANTGSPTYAQWMVCTWLETNAGISGVPTTGGYVHIDQNGSITSGC